MVRSGAKGSGVKFKAGFIEAHMRRPQNAEDLALSEFTAAYEETALSKRRMEIGSCDPRLLRINADSEGAGREALDAIDSGSEAINAMTPEAPLNAMRENDLERRRAPKIARRRR